MTDAPVPPDGVPDTGERDAVQVVTTRPLTREETEAVATARYIAARLHPFLASALFALQPVAADGLETFAVDAYWRVYIDPAKLAEWGPDASAAVFLHEVGHVVRDHAVRGHRTNARDRDDFHRWNVACDLAINDDLAADFIAMPEGSITPSTFGLDDELIEESYYELLDGVELPPRGPELYCGSGVGGGPASWELGPHGPVRGLPPTSQETIRTRIAEIVRQGVDMPQGWRRWAEEQNRQDIDWRRELHAVVAQFRAWRAGILEATWTRPDRRAECHPGLILPGRHAPSFELAVIVDTSMSISDRQLGAALAEIDVIKQRCGISSVWVIGCDTQPTPPQRVKSSSSVTFAGRGGTDLRPAFGLLTRLRPRPDAVIVITDGHTPWPDSPPVGISTVVATTAQPCPVPGTTTIHLDAF